LSKNESRVLIKLIL